MHKSTGPAVLGVAVLVAVTAALTATPAQRGGLREDPRAELHVLVTGSAAAPSRGNLWHTIRRQGNWQAWGDVIGAVAGNIGAIEQLAAVPTPQGLHVLAVGRAVAPSGGSLWHTIRQPNNWQAWGDVEAAVPGDVGSISLLAATALGNELHVVAVGSRTGPSGGNLWHTMRSARGWQAWGDVEAAVPGEAGAISHLAVAANNEGLHVLVAGNRLLHTIRRPNGWQAWGDVEAAVPGEAGRVSGVAAAATPEGLHVFVVGAGRSGARLWHTLRPPTGWQAWGDVEAAVPGDAGDISQLSATSLGAEVHVIVVGSGQGPSGGNLWHTIRRPNGWQAWGDVEAAAAGDVGTVLRLANGSRVN